MTSGRSGATLLGDPSRSCPLRHDTGVPRIRRVEGFGEQRRTQEALAVRVEEQEPAIHTVTWMVFWDAHGAGPHRHKIAVPVDVAGTDRTRSLQPVEQGTAGENLVLWRQAEALAHRAPRRNHVVLARTEVVLAGVSEAARRQRRLITLWRSFAGKRRGAVPHRGRTRNWVPRHDAHIRRGRRALHFGRSRLLGRSSGRRWACRYGRSRFLRDR